MILKPENHAESSKLNSKWQKKKCLFTLNDSGHRPAVKLQLRRSEQVDAVDGPGTTGSIGVFGDRIFWGRTCKCKASVYLEAELRAWERCSFFSNVWNWKLREAERCRRNDWGFLFQQKSRLFGQILMSDIPLISWIEAGTQVDVFESLWVSHKILCQVKKASRLQSLLVRWRSTSLCECAACAGRLCCWGGWKV